MSAEGPTVSAAINRLPDEVVMLAAMGLVTSLSVTIESPIINMLATSTALGRDRRAYLLLRRFTIHWMIALTAISVLVAYTSLFDLVVRRWMGVPENVAEWVRPGLRIMIFWSAAIGWRRFLQGILIRFKQTRKIAWGTAVRLAASGGTVICLAWLSELPGVVTGSIALMAGVIAEALYATVVTRPLVRREFGPDSVPQGEELTYRDLLRFHLPLAATSVLILMVQPMVAFSLARLAQPTLSLASWPVLFQLMLMARAAALALPEVVIALAEGGENIQRIRQFSLTLAVVNTVVMLLFVLTPLVDLYLRGVQDVDPEVGQRVRSGLLLFAPLPALQVFISWVRGLLIHEKRTGLVNAGMFVNLAATGAVLFLGVVTGWPGISAAALSLTAAAALELAFLWWRAKSVLRLSLPSLELGRPSVAPGREP
jgi:hypothetical protein